MASNFWEGKFYFNGVYSDTLSVCIVDFDSNEILKQYGLTTNFEFEKSSSLNGVNFYTPSDRNSDNLILQLCRTDGKPWNATTISQVNSWLFQDGFKKFQIEDISSNTNIIYYLKAVSFKKFLNNNYYGYLEIEFISYDNYAYIIPSSSFKLDTRITRINIFNYSTIDNKYKPIIKIRSNADNQNVIIGNSTNSSSLNLKSLQANETITVDCKMGTVINSYGENRFSLLGDYNLLSLNKGENSIYLNGSANVEIICEFPILL